MGKGALGGLVPWKSRKVIFGLQMLSKVSVVEVFMQLYAQRLDLFAWCVRLSRF